MLLVYTFNVILQFEKLLLKHILYLYSYTEQAQSAKFTNEIREVRIREGMKAKFEATYAGNPRPEFTWLFNGKDLPENEHFRIKIKDFSVSLTIYDATMDMSGYYKCVAKNDLGSDNTMASLTVNSKSTCIFTLNGKFENQL